MSSKRPSYTIEPPARTPSCVHTEPVGENSRQRPGPAQSIPKEHLHFSSPNRTPEEAAPARTYEPYLVEGFLRTSLQDLKPPINAQRQHEHLCIDPRERQYESEQVNRVPAKPATTGPKNSGLKSARASV
ncbi:hypothetical protein LshimejAT787_0702210 [Lyophyllum shimeji]|uniref:Uncharacterized protein n=1 Tax=Lyophyllum shimeji TaxID=47721 RepID=A0A9P3PQ39_LYOSH|nr:hypothetical protein LshimejAT787_0702210 [Lyophyllum shimeji]